MRKPAPKGSRTAPAKTTTRTAAERSAARSTERPAARAASRANAAGPADRPARRPAIRRPAPAPVKAAAKPAARPAAPRAKSAGQERLQKILAAAGIDSRRACEQIILDGRVQVNGRTVTELGTLANPRRDEITVDLIPIEREAPVYILMNKPKGYVTTVKDDQGRPTVMALLKGVPGPELLKEFQEGFLLSGRRLKPCHIEVAEKGDNPWLKVTLTEGKNQQIRRMFAAVGHPVSKLRRVQFGPLTDPLLKPGAWRYLNPQEIAAIKSL